MGLDLDFDSLFQMDMDLDFISHGFGFGFYISNEIFIHHGMFQHPKYLTLAIITFITYKKITWLILLQGVPKK